MNTMIITLPQLPELDSKSSEALDIQVLKQRGIAITGAKKDEHFWQSEYEYQGYIHLLKTSRFFIYCSKFNFYKSDDYTDPRYKTHILMEDTHEVDMDTWLDEMLINP